MNVVMSFSANSSFTSSFVETMNYNFDNEFVVRTYFYLKKGAVTPVTVKHRPVNYYFLNGQKVSLNHLASLKGVSKSTVSRMIKKAGLKIGSNIDSVFNN